MLLLNLLAPALPSIPAANDPNALRANIANVRPREISNPSPAETRAADTAPQKKRETYNKTPSRQGKKYQPAEETNSSRSHEREKSTATSDDIDTFAYRLQISLNARHLWKKTNASTNPDWNGKSIIEIRKSVGKAMPTASLYQSSGNSTLDKSALESIVLATQNVVPPEKLLAQDFRLLITIEFGNLQHTE